jgi:hypothetical protein
MRVALRYNMGISKGDTDMTKIEVGKRYEITDTISFYVGSVVTIRRISDFSPDIAQAHVKRRNGHTISLVVKAEQLRPLD